MILYSYRASSDYFSILLFFKRSVCPETYRWFPIASCRPKLDASKYKRLAPIDEEDPGRRASEESVADMVLVLFRRTAMLYRVYKSQMRRLTASPPSDEPEVKTYAALVGPEVASRMLLYRALPRSSDLPDEEADSSENEESDS